MVKTAIVVLAATAATADAGECYCSCCNWCHMSECYDGHSCCDDPSCSGCGHELEDETPEWVKSARAAAALQAPAKASAGGCSADDQKKVADAKTVGDKSQKCGKDAFSLSGIDHDKFTQCVQSELSISASCSECYYAVADYGFKNCKAACLLGWCKSGCLSCSQPAQDAFPACAGFSPSKADPCLETASTGACSADEQGKITGMSAKDFGDKSNKCGTQALGLTGINHDKFNSCMKTEVGIDTACSECYAVTADYGFKNCKAACLLGWCKQGCLSCTQPAQDDLPACTGFAAGKADPCDSLGSTGACSADDQAALKDTSAVGKAGSKCGLAAFSITGGFNHDKFNTCFTGELSVSSGCSECYAVNGEYASKNCKAACLLGWCKKGCLDCSTAAEPKAALDSCTGFTSGTADPCMDDVAV